MDSSAADRLAYIFGSRIDLEIWRGADEDERATLVQEHFGARSDADSLLRSVVLEQIVADKPAGVWATAQRLDAAGLDVAGVLDQITIVLAQTMRDAIEPVTKGSAAEVGTESQGPEAEQDAEGRVPSDPGSDGPPARALEAFAARLGRLPLPPPEDVEATLVELAADAVLIGSEMLVDVAASRYDRWSGDPLFTSLVSETLSSLLQDSTGPLAPLPGERVGHVELMCAGVVLTHVLTEEERDSGELLLSEDLPIFAHLAEPVYEGESLELVSTEDGLLAWKGSERWLTRFAVGTTLTVRADGGTVHFDVLPQSPPVDPALVERVTAGYHSALDESDLPAATEEVLLGLVADDPFVFDRPAAPFSAACDATGLERDGHELAHDPTMWVNKRRLLVLVRVFDEARKDEDLADDVVAVLDVAYRQPAGGADDGDEGDGTDNEDLDRALQLLDDEEVLSVLGSVLFDAHHWPEQRAEAEALVDRLSAAARRPKERAGTHYLAALLAERNRNLSLAEQHLRLAVQTGTVLTLALDRLAWYASDQGDAVRALGLWKRCPANRHVVADIRAVEPHQGTGGSTQGRNSPCWCGSGRKYKHCHLGVAEKAPLGDRVGWLYRKAAGYLARSGHTARRAFAETAATMVADLDDEAILRAVDNPMTTDLLLNEGGWFDRFLAERTTLLPDDEALLAASWGTVGRSLYEVVHISRGSAMTVKDLRTGETYEIQEATPTRTVHPGMVLCGRAVPDGTAHRFVGGLVGVPPGRETDVLDLLDEGDLFAIAAWIGSLDRPPVIQTREGEPIMQCEILVTSSDVDQLVTHLDATYERDLDDDACWTELHPIDDDESLIRASFRLDGDRLTITTNSNQRADRILGCLHGAGVPGLEVLQDERAPFDPANPGASQRGGLPDLLHLAPALSETPSLDEATVAQLQEGFEKRWCDEEVPALGGLTPRQAAADPTRREQLTRLIASFEAMPPPPARGFTMRPHRLRSLLNLR